MDRFTHKLDELVSYGHKHTGMLNLEQKRQLVIALMVRDEFMSLWMEFNDDKKFEVGQNFRDWRLKQKTTEESANFIIDLFFDYHVDLIDEMFEAFSEERQTDYSGDAISGVLIGHIVFKEAHHAHR
jgi:hypothetical protein